MGNRREIDLLISHIHEFTCWLLPVCSPLPTRSHGALTLSGGRGVADSGGGARGVAASDGRRLLRDST